MRNFTVGSGVALPIFDVAPDDPWYWLKRESFENCLAYHLANAQGMQVYQAEEGDFNGLRAKLSVYQGQINSMLADLFAYAIDDTGQATLPTAPEITPMIDSLLPIMVSGAGALVPVLLEVFLDASLQYLVERFSRDSDFSEVAEVLRRIFMEKEIVEGEEVEFSAFGKAFLDKNAEGLFFSLLWPLIRQPLHLIVNKYGGDVDDILFGPEWEDFRA